MENKGLLFLNRKIKRKKMKRGGKKNMSF